MSNTKLLFKKGILEKKSFPHVSKKHNIHLETAANLIYSALQDEKCSDVKQHFSHYLNDHTKTLNMQVLYDDFHKSVLHQLRFSKDKRGLALEHAQNGGSSLKACMLAGFMIVFISISIFLMQIHSENAHYRMHCADINELLSPKSNKVDTFFDHIHKLNAMIFNKAQLEHCKILREKQGTYIYDFVETVHSTTKDFTTILKTVGSIIVFLITIFSSGVKGLVCLAAKFVNDSEICGIECEKLNIRIPSVTRGEAVAAEAAAVAATASPSASHSSHSRSHSQSHSKSHSQSQ